MSITLTSNEVITRALLTLGVIQPGETLSAAQGQQGRDLIAEMIDAWNLQALTVLSVSRDVYTLTAGKGGPDNPYSIGPGGDFDTGSQPRPVSIRNANLRLNTASDYPTEIPLAILTEDMYAANPIKSIQNAQPQTLYYQASDPLGSIQLWNIPNTAVNQLVLYTDVYTAQFIGLNVAYICPPGYAKAFRLGCAAVMAPYFGVPGERAAGIERDAAQALVDVKMSNVQMADLSYDPLYVQDQHGTYVIQTDQGA